LIPLPPNQDKKIKFIGRDNETKTKKSVWLVMVSVFGLAKSPYNDLVQKDLNKDIFF
jgi:hypothetical protein